VAIKGQTKLTITLATLTASLEKVVVIGYGVSDAESYYQHDQNLAKTKSITGAVPSKPNSPFYSLQSRVPGVAVTGQDRKKEKKDNWRNNNNYNTEDYDKIIENRFLTANENPLSTFSIDVDAASYSNVRRYLQSGLMPPAGSVRIEEMINYFHYEYPQPVSSDPFSINTEMADCPWNNKHKLVLIGLQGKKIPVENLPASNLVFLIDVSGSMMDENKLPLVKSSMKLLVDNLREQDRVSIAVYAGSAGLVLPSTSGPIKR
jgi:Ca-activated chloride channel family protein